MNHAICLISWERNTIFLYNNCIKCYAILISKLYVSVISIKYVATQKEIFYIISLISIIKKNISCFRESKQILKKGNRYCCMLLNLVGVLGDSIEQVCEGMTEVALL